MGYSEQFLPFIAIRRNAFLYCMVVVFTVPSIFGEDIMCYSCFSLNYRSQVAPRNGAPPPPQDAKNLSEISSVIRQLGIIVPQLSDGCADVSLTAQPSFLSAPRTLCRENVGLCAKLNFIYKGEKVVVRDCFSSFHFNYRLPKENICLERPFPNSFHKTVSNTTFCSCGHSLCNDSPQRTISMTFVFFMLLFGYNCS